MFSSALHLSLAVACLALTVCAASPSRSNVGFDSALESPQSMPAGEQGPEMYNLPEFQWMLSNVKREAIETDIPSEEAKQRKIELMKRDDNKERKPGCKNYFWKSRTAC